MEWFESTLNDLHTSAVNAFPNTRKRQHAIDPIRIVEVTWTPYLGMKTLFTSGRASSGDKEYKPLILFKNVAYHENNAQGLVGLAASDGQDYFLEKINLADHDVVVRCNCPDFHWRFNYFDHLDKSLYGRKRAPYQALFNPGSANPQEMPGICKHIMKFARVLSQSGIVG